TDLPEQVDAAHAWQPHVGEDHVGAQPIQHLERLLGIAGDLDLKPGFREVAAYGAGQGAFVVDDEDGAAAHALPAIAGAAGKWIPTVVPWPTVLLITSVPPFCSTNRFAIARPSPVPSGRVVKNGSVTVGSSSAGMPLPVSEISTMTLVRSALTRVVTPSVPPPGIASSALAISSCMVCSTFIGSSMVSG